MKRIITTLLGIAILIVGNGSANAQQTKPNRQAHAHNDYLHDRPLLDALDAGFCSVEADIFLVEGQLLVAHTKAEIKPERTLRSMYLEPLKARIQKNDGKVHPGVPDFTLLIDIKTDGPSTYQALNKLLSEFKEIFTSVENGVVHPGAVTAIVSGNRPIELIAAEKVRYVGVDGRVSDLDSDSPSHLIPMISDSWFSHFKWRGNGEMPAEEKQKLASIVEKSHNKKRLVRFWATPDNAVFWGVLKDAGVDMINTDDLVGLSKFLSK